MSYQKPINMNIVQKNCTKLDEQSSNLQNAIYVLLTTGARRQDPHMVPHVVVPPTNLFSFIFLFLIYFVYGNTDKQVFWHVRVDWCIHNTIQYFYSN